jgi:hypothetical protein
MVLPGQEARMNSQSRLPALATGCLVLAQLACSVFGGAVPATQRAAPPTITANSAATAAATATPGPTVPAPTPATAATPAAAATTAPHSPALGADLNYAEMQAILAASFAVYPHRVRSTTVITGSSTSNLVIEATDLEHIHMISTSTLSTGTAPRESILISPTLYMKPPGGTWRLATPDEQGLADTLVAAADPSRS